MCSALRAARMSVAHTQQLKRLLQLGKVAMRDAFTLISPEMESFFLHSAARALVRAELCGTLQDKYIYRIESAALPPEYEVTIDTAMRRPSVKTYITSDGLEFEPISPASSQVPRSTHPYLRLPVSESGPSPQGTD
jgi:hypothetical protein